MSQCHRPQSQSRPLTCGSVCVVVLLYYLVVGVHCMGTHILHAGPSCFIQPNRPESATRPTTGQSVRTHRGTCYSSLLCKQKSGVAIGKCGLGNDCCIFPQTCGSVSVRNATYFTNAHYPKDSNRSEPDCSLTINRTPGIHRICQLRLDFIEYEVEGHPTSKSPSMAKDANESENLVETDFHDDDDDNCGNDRISVRAMHTAEDIAAPICARKIGHHVTIDVQKHLGPFLLTVHSARKSSSAALHRVTRRWNILVSQIECYRLTGTRQPTMTLVNRTWNRTKPRVNQRETHH